MLVTKITDPGLNSLIATAPYQWREEVNCWECSMLLPSPKKDSSQLSTVGRAVSNLLGGQSTTGEKAVRRCEGGFLFTEAGEPARE